MASAAVLGPPAAGEAAQPIAVIDVGSNSVRLVVFESLSRAPAPIFNEKVLCGLGRGLSQSKRLDPEGRAAALTTLSRFAALTQAMNAEVIDVVATAAMREAEDGKEFAAQVEADCGLRVKVLSGTEEARLSALGVIAAGREADGLMAALGGGSLEVVKLVSGDLRDQATLPLGSLRTPARGSRELVKTIDRALEELPWLKDAQGKTFYAVGGAWRAFARVHMARQNYPLHIIHGFAMGRRDAEAAARFLAKAKPEMLEGLEGVPRRRADTLPFAGHVLERLLKATQADDVVFCGHGLREGLVYDRLDKALQASDPFMAAARDSALRTGRFSAHAEDIERWIAPLFEDTDGEDRRLRLAACLLSDSAWRWHPDYRAEQGFISILHSPYVGIGHAGRAFVALAVAARYGASTSEKWLSVAKKLLTKPDVQKARALGAALYLANTLTGGTAGVLASAPLRRQGRALELRLSGQNARLAGETVQRRFETLARELGLEARFEIE